MGNPIKHCPGNMVPEKSNITLSFFFFRGKLKKEQRKSALFTGALTARRCDIDRRAGGEMS